MPTYTYQCRDCGHRYDAFQSMKDDAFTECPVCKGNLERLIGAGAGIVFKGSGFYVTDYRKQQPPSSESSGSAPSGTESAKPNPPVGDAAKPASSSGSSGASSD